MSSTAVKRGATKPVILDLCCGAGGAAWGYYRAGWNVIGVDTQPQPHYPFAFIQEDMFDYLKRATPKRFAAVHASPPCERYSYMSACRPELAQQYPDYIPLLRERLLRIGLPYVIENVPGSPLRKPIMLCGASFGYQIYRHRLFESNVAMDQPHHRAHRRATSKAGHHRPRTMMSVSGHIAPISLARKVMDINWMTREELRKAIPPYYTEYVGKQLMKALQR